MLVDKRVAIHKEGTFSQRKARRLGRKITTSLKEDCKERAQKAGMAIMMEHDEGNIKEAWWLLYAFKALTGKRISANKEPILLPDEAPPDEEIGAMVKTLQNRRTDSGTMIRAEDLKNWHTRVEMEEKMQKEGTEELKGTRLEH